MFGCASLPPLQAARRSVALLLRSVQAGDVRRQHPTAAVDLDAHPAVHVEGAREAAREVPTPGEGGVRRPVRGARSSVRLRPAAGGPGGARGSILHRVLRHAEPPLRRRHPGGTRASGSRGSSCRAVRSQLGTESSPDPAGLDRRARPLRSVLTRFTTLTRVSAYERSEWLACHVACPILGAVLGAKEHLRAIAPLSCRSVISLLGFLGVLLLLLCRYLPSSATLRPRCRGERQEHAGVEAPRAAAGERREDGATGERDGGAVARARTRADGEQRTDRSTTFESLRHARHSALAFGLRRWLLFCHPPRRRDRRFLPAPRPLVAVLDRLDAERNGAAHQRRGSGR